MNALKERYRKEIVPVLMKELGLDNVMQVPKIEKIVLNIGMGEAIEDKKALDEAVKDIEIITGQKLTYWRCHHKDGHIILGAQQDEQILRQYIEQGA